MPCPEKSYDRLAGLTALVTGAGSVGEGASVGRAISTLFAREGAKVGLFDLEAARAENTLRTIRDEGGDAIVLAGDVTEEGDCARAAGALAERFGGIDILVNNVGILTKGVRLEDTTPEDWRRGIDVDLNGAFLMTRAALPHLLASRGKAVLNIVSVAGIKAYSAPCYSAAKAGMIQLARDLAFLYGAEGLRANAIAPGHILTPMVDHVLSEEDLDARRRIQPLPVTGDAWDIAQAAVFLASAEARLITGVCLPVDGGSVSVGPLVAHQRLPKVS